MAYVYKHMRLDNNDVFYIGIGVRYNRVNSHKSRNVLWKNIVNKYGMVSEIIEDNLTWDEACSREKFWINYYGRKNNDTGNLSNMTDGGEGTYGRVLTNETKNKIKNSHLGKKLSEEHKMKISEGNKGKPKPKPKYFSEKMSNIVKGHIRSEESKLKQSITTKETLSKIRDKLSEKSKGIKNSNSVRYYLFNTLINKTIEIDGYKSVLIYYNQITNQNKKDSMFLIKKIKENKIDELKFISSCKINLKH